MLASAIGAVLAGRRRARAAARSTGPRCVQVVSNAPLSNQIWIFLGFFLAFAVKAPLVPLHTWLPDAAAEAPIGVAVILIGVLDKVGTFGFLRYLLPMTPDASAELAPLVLVMGVAGVLYGAMLATGQRDMKRFIAYVSIAHFGFIALGIFAFSTQSEVGAVSYMLNHSISTGMLILVIGMVDRARRLVADRRLRRPGEDHAGAGRRVPARRSRVAVAARHELVHLASSWCWSGPTAASRCTRSWRPSA